MDYSKDFWDALEQLVSASSIVIDRKKESAHPRYADFIYPVDYGYLDNTKSMDGDGIDVWLGSNDSKKINGIICTVDLYKRDSEIKVLISCTEKEIEKILKFHNKTDSMKGLYIKKRY